MGFTEIVNLLLKKFIADPNKEDSKGRKAHQVANKACLKIFKAFDGMVFEESQRYEGDINEAKNIPHGHGKIYFKKKVNI